MVDYASTEEVYWQIPGDEFDFRLLPSRAFDSAQEREQTQAIFNDYSKTHVVDPALNARFAELADQRVARSPFRYYVSLPALRIADMWLRPRAEMLPLDTRWWEYANDTESCVLATLWGVLNLLFLFAAVMGVVRGPRPQYLALMLLVRALALGISGNAGKSRASLYAGMFSQWCWCWVRRGCRESSGLRIDATRASLGRGALYMPYSGTRLRFEGAWLQPCRNLPG